MDLSIIWSSANLWLVWREKGGIRWLEVAGRSMMVEHVCELEGPLVVEALVDWRGLGSVLEPSVPGQIASPCDTHTEEQFRPTLNCRKELSWIRVMERTSGPNQADNLTWSNSSPAKSNLYTHLYTGIFLFFIILCKHTVDWCQNGVNNTQDMAWVALIYCRTVQPLESGVICLKSSLAEFQALNRSCALSVDYCTPNAHALNVSISSSSISPKSGLHTKCFCVD